MKQKIKKKLSWKQKLIDFLEEYVEYQERERYGHMTILDGRFSLKKRFLMFIGYLPSEKGELLSEVIWRK